MTKNADTASAATPAAAAPTTAADLIASPEPELTSGGKSPIAAADAADILASSGGAAGAGEAGAPAAPPPIGRASPRAKAGFNNAHSKAELIRRGRELAKYAAELELKVGVRPEGAGEGDGESTAVVAVDPEKLEKPLAEVAGVVSDFLSAWRGDHWKFTAEEREKIGKAAAPVIAELTPSLGEHASKLMLVLVVVGVAMPRLQQDRELAAKKGSQLVPAP